LIERGADPNVELDGTYAGCFYSVGTYTDQLPTDSDQSRMKTLLQFAAYKENEVLLKYLIEQGVKDIRDVLDVHWSAR
jgi:hypothetical protein